MRFYRGVEGRQTMSGYLNTEPTPQKPGAAEAIERLQVALRHLRAAKLALTDLAYAPACGALSGYVVEDDVLEADEAFCDAKVKIVGAIEALGGKPDMDSHYSGRQQAEAFDMALRCVALVPDAVRVREKLRIARDMAWRMA